MANMKDNMNDHFQQYYYQKILLNLGWYKKK